MHLHFSAEELSLLRAESQSILSAVSHLLRWNPAQNTQLISRDNITSDYNMPDVEYLSYKILSLYSSYFTFQAT